MENVKMTLNGKILNIEVDLSKKGVPSKTGKTTVIASTKGNVEVPGKPEMRLGLNLYTK